MKNQLRASLITLSLCLLANSSWADTSGTVKTIRGKVQVQRDGTLQPLQVGDALQTLDRIIVPPQGSAGFTLRDDTLISLGPNSSLLIQEMRFDPQTQEGSVITSIIKGSMRYVSGLIGRLNPSAVQIDTPNSTIGIRGTEFIIEVDDAS